MPIEAILVNQIESPDCPDILKRNLEGIALPVLYFAADTYEYEKLDGTEPNNIFGYLVNIMDVIKALTAAGKKDAANYLKAIYPEEDRCLAFDENWCVRGVITNGVFRTRH